MTAAGKVRFGLLPVGTALGLFAEWAALRRGPLAEGVSAADLRLAAADLAVGLALIGCGLVVWSRTPQSRIGSLLAAAGFAWFLGTFAGSGDDAYASFGSLFVTLHRGPLIHAILSYPNGRLSGRLDRALVAFAYLYAAIEPLGQNEIATIVVLVLVAGSAARRYFAVSGPLHRARKPALVAGLGVASVLVVESFLALAGVSSGVERAVLWAYQVVLLAITVGFTLDLLLGGWTRTTVTGLVVDLGELAEMGTLRDRLASALGDRSLEVGYWLPAEDRYIDEAGHPVALPEPGSGREVTLVGQDGQPVAALIHDPAVLDDRELIDSVASAAQLAFSNVLLQAEIRRQVDELALSRRRIVEAGDAQRRRLERQLRDGAELRLVTLEALIEDSGLEAPDHGEASGQGGFAAMLAETRQEIDRAQAELREFAQGIHPRVLTEGGLPAGLAELVGRAPVPVELSAPVERYPAAIEAAVYFVCSEALANIGKYAQASRASIALMQDDGRLSFAIEDDGIGGASLDSGSGLRGLADRVEALGGSLGVHSPPGEGTRLRAELPVT